MLEISSQMPLLASSTVLVQLHLAFEQAILLHRLLILLSAKSDLVIWPDHPQTYNVHLSFCKLHDTTEFMGTYI